MATRTIAIGAGGGSGDAAVTAHIADTVGAHAASAISVTAPDGTGNLTAAVTTVQALVDEVDGLTIPEPTLTLGLVDPIPPGTPDGTLVFREAT